MKKHLILLLFFISVSSSVFAGNIHYLTVDGIVNPVMSEFIVKGIQDAVKENAEAVVIQLDTPGGLDLSMRDIVKAILSSDVPIIVYVAPAGSRAASAGVFITYAAHVAAMAPGTNIGSAHPVAMGGEKMDETMMKKVENDAVAYIKGIAAKRHRNAEWAEKAVRKSENITAEEALKLKVIDLIAQDKKTLFEAIDGRKVEMISGEKVLKTAKAEVKEVEMGLRYRILNAITNPNVAYILMMIGLIGLYFELSNPGLILPGVVGAICLVLAFYAFQTLSVNYAGLLLIGLAALFFIAEIKVTSYGLLTVAGIIALTIGSLMLFESPLPFMRLSLWVVLPTVVTITALFLGAMYYGLKIRHKKPVSGMEGLIDEIGVANTDIANEGKVFIDGEYWDAWSDEQIKEGEKVKVLDVKGLKLKVVRI
ncbi:MAG: serine protease [Deltaproteobacteria bacterium RIFCSPLOWO2_12_FULL_43_16]|nr:MAG: serine protease [Deltaproteobacteria bacterium GWA2_43_19]OGQ11023.1 MAG: serine protease [Deltaproteobacteria bacterium RIFCSPHIGHO2_02_FULL_43_33]OGQ61856.1 MAG: serine protease [Deltaproteobacteria bacterium RIFCSPLOWO2_12_FULL_43_16]HBR16021.1 serine protease [Deltaproteobacteria bacterium]